MANFTGTYTTNQTANNGDSITGSITIDSGCTFTISAGATVSATGAYSITVGTGVLVAVGTESAPIIMKSSVADPTKNSWTGFVINNAASTATMTWVKIISAATPINISNYTSISISKIWAQNCSGGLTFSKANVSPTITGMIIDNCTSGLFLTSSGTGTRTLNNFCAINGTTLNGALQDVGLTISGLLVRSINCGSNVGLVYAIAGTLTLQDSYFTSQTASYLVISNAASAAVVASRNVFTSILSGIRCANATGSFASSFNDFIVGLSPAMVASAASTSADDYIVGFNGKPDYTIDTTETGSTQYTAANITRTNARSTPNKPLSADNISEGAPTANGITITFDCAAGATSTYRVDAIPFIEYGTATGVYTMSTMNNFPDDSH